MDNFAFVEKTAFLLMYSPLTQHSVYLCCKLMLPFGRLDGVVTGLTRAEGT